MEKAKANSSYPVRYMIYLGFDKCAAAENTGMIRSSRAAHFCRTTSITAVEIWKSKAYVWPNIAVSDVEWEKHRKVVATLWGSYAKPLDSQGRAAGRDVRHFN
jgi:hypothetical protein